MFVIFALSIAILTAGWFISLRIDPGTRAADAAPGYGVSKHIRYSFTLQNRSGRRLEGAKLWVFAPVSRSATQQCKALNSTPAHDVQPDAAGNQVLYFSFSDLGPYASGVIDVRAELVLSNRPNPIAISAEESAAYLQPGPFVESDHPVIVHLAGQWDGADPMSRAGRIFDWVAGHVQDAGYMGSERGALYALTQGRGDCSEYADLFVALCRASGIPARTVGGYVCRQSTVLRPADYHNWAEFYHGGTWHLADPQKRVLGQDSADYVAMRIMGMPPKPAAAAFQRFRVTGDGLVVRMN
jgi:transglutaminase-like putative cysteine protease